MDRSIPHVLDVFTSSPGARRRMKLDMVTKEKAELQKNPGSDSAVSVGSSDEEECEDQRNISKYFDYLNEDDFNGGSSQRRKKQKKTSQTKVENIGGEHKKDCNLVTKNEKNKQNDTNKKARSNRKGEYEKDIRHLERHLSMKKTIRKKIMRDLQQAFVEDPKDLQQDPKYLTKEKKNNIDINNLTLSKNRLSKSEHNFLDMLKEDQTKERKGLRGLIDFRKDKPTPISAVTTKETKTNGDSSKYPNKEIQTTDRVSKSSTQVECEPDCDIIKDDDSGHGSPTREPRNNTFVARRTKSKDDLLDVTDDPSAANIKKQSFWKRITGKGKSKR